VVRSRLAPWLLASCGALFAFLALSTPRADARTASDSAVPASGSAKAAASATPAPRARQTQPLQALGEMTLDPARGRYVARYGSGRAVLSVSPSLQQGLEKLLAEFRVPMGAVVLLDPRTGRVLALAEHAERDHAAQGPIALRAIAPAASVFKIVTSAALLQRGLTPDSEVCFHGGKHRIQKALLTDNPRRDRRCLTLASALGKSANVVFAKLAGRGLSSEQLRAEANQFLFNSEIPFGWPVEPSPAAVSDDPFDLATTAAGFGPVRLSPLHGALIAAIVANRGTLVPPRIIDGVEGAALPQRAESRQVVSRDVAAALTRMMRTTTTEGTARKVFGRDRWNRRSPLNDVAVAGKTGSLSDREPFRDYSWFVGFAPADNPQIAVSAVVVNERLWRIKAPFVAREALLAYFAGEAERTRTAAR
jgi:cell division protein FtsI/penicillin-binding protein 2